jgi:choline dehydrogenase
MKIARRIVENPALDRYRSFEMNPGERYQTDDELLEFARLHGQTAYHVVGTCKMGQDPMAVVDDQLRVHGLAGLRVVDASIMPTMTSGNTNAPVIMIAEKAADLIKAAAARPARAA